MPNRLKPYIDFRSNPASHMAFSVAACAFASALVGAALTPWLAGWMAVGGMFGIGCFYTVIGILNMRKISSFDTRPSSTVSERTARLANLYSEPVPDAKANEKNSQDSSTRFQK